MEESYYYRLIYIDRPRTIVFKGKNRLASHCVSPSLTDLHDFAALIGLPERAFHDKPFRPHYDLFDHTIDMALRAGAQQISNRELVQLLQRYYGI
jgi:hypothetical protein